ncbi:MAG: lipoic acid synthetase [Oleiphilaceae bacterium]|jgi:lipoic acid synthetase
MSDRNLIPTTLIHSVPIKSGKKFINDNGITAIKNGIKASSKESQERLKKPSWLRIKATGGAVYNKTKNIVHKHKLSTVCEEAMCPNISECWSSGTATIMLMGDTCTRACRFCAVNTGNPQGWLDKDEAKNTAESVKLMGLKYLVLTSVNRDDLEDGGAGHYAEVVRRVKAENPEIAVEALTPDFEGIFGCIEIVVDSGIVVFAQNVETVKRLTHPVRDPRATYEQTLAVLKHAKQYKPEVLTKTSIMLGLGETEEEIIEAMDDLRAINCDILTFGQYLQPTVNHLPIERYVTPQEFEKYRQWGLDRGFLEVVSGALVRSSYRAEQVLMKNNVGLSTETK